MSEDATLASPEAPSVFGTPTPVPVMPETPLDLDELVSQGRLVERTARICIRGDLFGEYTAKVQELAELVDEHGEVLSEGDQALSDTSRAQQLSREIEALRAEMKTWMRSVQFRAIPSDEWPGFTKPHFDAAGKLKDEDDWNEHLIVRCAIKPTLARDQVKQIRTKIGHQQFVTLANTAYYACTIGGLDVPKSPDFSLVPTRADSDKN